MIPERAGAARRGVDGAPSGAAAVGRGGESARPLRVGSQTQTRVTPTLGDLDLRPQQPKSRADPGSGLLWVPHWAVIQLEFEVFR